MKSSKFKLKQDYWSHHVSAWQKSGLSQTEYCRQSGLKLSTFSTWVGKLNNKIIPSVNPEQTGSFARVMERSQKPMNICLRYPSGVVLELDSLPDATWLLKACQA